MIALDSSALIAFLKGDDTPAAAAAGLVLAERQACLPPVVLAEGLSDPKLPKRVADLIGALPLLEVADGYWRRAGELRSQVLAAGHRACLAATLIAQSCLDHDVSLVSSDRGFRHFARAGGLRLLP